MPVAGHLSPSAQGGLAVEVPAPELPSVPRLFSQTLLQHMPEQDEMRLFPGPLGKYVPAPTPGHCLEAVAALGRTLWLVPFTECRSFFRDDTHKVDVINFAQNKATKCLQNENLIDKESASLLWNFIVLLCRQNGVRVSYL